MSWNGQRAFVGSDSESRIMYPDHPEHDNLVSHFYISSSDSDVSSRHGTVQTRDQDFKEGKIYLTIRIRENSNSESELSLPIIEMINVRRILYDESESDITLEDPSGTGWDSDAIEFPHNLALLTEDGYYHYNNIYELLCADNNC